MYCAHHPSCADDVHVRIHDLCCLLTAWLLRLPEVVRASGLLLVVSAGPYGETALLPHLTDRCVRACVQLFARTCPTLLLVAIDI